jgi:cytochrome P450
MLSFDPATPGHGFFSNPYPTYRMLREQDPIHRCPDGTWFLTRYADLERIYRNRSSFSSDKKAVFAPKFGDRSPLYEHHTSSLVFNDPPYHTRVRRAVVGALTPRVLKDMRPGIIDLLDRLLARIEAKGEFDAIQDFAAAIPVEVIGNLLSVPQAERGPLREWSLAILGALEPVRTAGTLLEPGAYLHLCIGAANRDPEVFPGPDRFDVARTPNPHLAFAAGAHACAGMSVARLEAQLAIQHIVRRFPRLRLHGEPVRGARARFRGFSVLPLATH